MKAGEELPPRPYGPVGIQDFVRYQGASGDLNPMHHDPEVARAAGFHDVFCPGMLSAGVLGSYVGDHLGAANVRELAVSFREMVWPGEVLTCRATVREVAEADGERRAVLDLVCERPDGSHAVVGDAVWALADNPGATAVVVTREQPLRWADTDGLGHVWHGNHIAFIEEVRTAWLNEVAGDGRNLWDHVVVRVEIDYRGELRYADGVAVARCQGAGFGRSSVKTVERVETPSGELVAEAQSVVVAWDPDAGAARPLTDSERAALERAQ